MRPIATPPIGVRAHRLPYVLVAVAILGCSEPSPNASSPSSDGSPSLIHIPDGGFHPEDFACPDGASVALPDAEPDGSDAASCIASNASVRFSVDVAPILGSCSGELCHDAWKYSTTVGIASLECCDRRKLIEPGLPGQSYLLQKMKGVDLCGNSSEMPPGVVVSQSVLDVVTSWVCLGALNN